MEENEKNVQNQEAQAQTDSNKDKGENKKILKVALIVVVLVLVLLVGIVIGLVTSGKTITQIISGSSQTEKTVDKKIDNSKPWVYDADYSKNSKVKRVSTYSTNDLVIPYININSKYAEQVNQELNKIYEDAYKNYIVKSSTEGQCYDSEYKYYENGNILSIVLNVTDFNVPGGTGYSKVYTYNFNTDTLEKATDEDLAKFCGFKTLTDVKDKITKWDSQLKLNPEVNEISTYRGIKNIPYYIDANGKLNFIYTIDAAGTMDKNMVVEPNKEIQVIVDTPKTQITSKKSDESKPWVYDADYSKNVEVKKVDTYSTNDLVIPYININSQYAIQVNQELNKIFQDAYKNYIVKSSTEGQCYDSEYKYYENGNILSIVLNVTDFNVPGGTGYSKVYTYNFNTDTLEKATDEDLAKFCGFKTLTDVKDKITKWDSQLKSNPEVNEVSTYKGIKDIPYYIDADGKLNFIYTIDAAGTMDKNMVVEPNAEIKMVI